MTILWKIYYSCHRFKGTSLHSNSTTILFPSTHENSVEERNGLVTKSWSIEFLQEKIGCSVDHCGCTSHMKLWLTKL